MRRYAVGAGGLLLAAASSILWARQGAEPPAVVRKMLLQQDLSIPGYSVVLVSVEIPPGGREGRHIHSGALAGYVQEGVVILDSEGKPSMTYKAGDTFFVEAGKIHEGINNGTVTARAIATLVVPKGQPLTTPVK